MAQVEDISRYLSDDTVFNKISKQFISIHPDDIRRNNPLLNSIFEKLIDAMRLQSPLFAKTYQRIVWAGSYYKKTRFGQPEEYDLNFVINLPYKEKDLKFISTDRPGFIKIHVAGRDGSTLNIDSKAYKELKSFIDDQSYLNQEKFRTWMEGIFSKVGKATDTNGSNRIILDDHPPIRIKKTGPAFTLIFKPSYSERDIDIDVVPVLAFSTDTLPPINCSRKDILQSRSDRRSARCWSAVPKPLNNSRGAFADSRHRYWRLCFYEFEKDMISSHNYGRIKPVIRQLKKLRDTQGWKSIASYYLETLCYHEKEIFYIFNRNSNTFLFFTMLEKLRDAFRNNDLRYYWDDDLNLLDTIGPEEMKNMKGRLDNVLKSIRKDIKSDLYAIAKWVLNEDELDKLKKNVNKYVNVDNTVPEPESEPENFNQWNCVIF